MHTHITRFGYIFVINLFPLFEIKASNPKLLYKYNYSITQKWNGKFFAEKLIKVSSFGICNRCILFFFYSISYRLALAASICQALRYSSRFHLCFEPEIMSMNYEPLWLKVLRIESLPPGVKVDKKAQGSNN